MYLNHVYGSYSCFTHQYELIIIPDDNPVIATASTNDIFCLDQFDSCRYLSQSYIFSKKCWKRITERKSLKYSIFNRISQLCYQNYLSAIENSSIVKEAVIARTHPVVTIWKLKPNNRFNPGS